MDAEDIWDASVSWMANLWDHLAHGVRVIGSMIIPEPAKPDYSLLKGVRAYGYQPSCPTPEQNMSPAWGVTTQEASDSLTSAFGGQSNRALLTLMKTIESEISPEGIDGIEPCGYEEL